MSPEENKAIVARYLEQAWGKGNWDVAEEVVADDVVFHDQVREGGLPPGREGMREAMRRTSTGLPDFSMDVHDMIAEDDKVVIRWSSTGTHAGDFNGFPGTGRSVTLNSISIVRMEDGRIVEGWQESDQIGAARQLGMLPSGTMPRPLASLIVFGLRLKDRLTSRRG